MKRIVLALLLVLFLASSSSAFVVSIGSGEKTSDTLIYTVVSGTRCSIAAVQVITDGSNDAKIIAYDNTAASGTVITEITVTSSDNFDGRVWIFPRLINTGIYVDVSGTGASFIVEYILD